MSSAQPSPPTSHTLLRRQLSLQFGDTFTLSGNVRLSKLIACEQTLDKRLAQQRSLAGNKNSRVVCLLVHGQPHAQTEFGVIFEQGIRPRRTSPMMVDGIRGRGQIAAVNGRATRRISDEQAVSKQLCQQFDVRCFAATRAGSREFEKRLEQLHILDVGGREPVPIEIAQRTEEVPIGAFCLAQWLL